MMRIKKHYSIKTLTDCPTIAFAAEELERYLRKLTAMEQVVVNDYREDDFILCLFSQLPERLLFAGENDDWNDEFMIKSHEDKLFLGGSNPRSVLFAVYKYLESLGFTWLYPGEKGEVMPDEPIVSLSGYDIREKAARRIRGIAGLPVNDRTGIDLVDWMAKKKMNYYFLEGFLEDRPGDELFEGEKPIHHTEHLFVDKSWRGRQRVFDMQKKVLDEARKRGLIIERFGHGWDLGLDRRYAERKGLSLSQARSEIKARGNITEQPGDNEKVWRQNCMSNPLVRDIYVDHISSFLERHCLEQDVAAIWLGDGFDNACQCSECRKKSFSDWYLMILRQVALHLKKAAPKLKIECVIYFVTMEPPTRNYLEGLDNIVLAFAPWDRCFSHSLDDPDCRFNDWRPDFHNNRSHDLARGRRPLNGDYFSYYRQWREVLPAPCYLFDYFTWSNQQVNKHYLSYDCFSLVRDFNRLEELGLEGCVACHPYCKSGEDLLRIIEFPTNLILESMAEALWDKSQTSTEIRTRYLTRLFGGGSEAIKRYMDEMRSIFALRDPHENTLVKENPDNIAEMYRRLHGIYRDMDRIFSAASCAAHGRECLILLKADFLIQYTTVAASHFRHQNRLTEIDSPQSETIRYLRRNEKLLQHCYDYEHYRNEIENLADSASLNRQ